MSTLWKGRDLSDLRGRHEHTLWEGVVINDLGEVISETLCDITEGHSRVRECVWVKSGAAAMTDCDHCRTNDVKSVYPSKDAAHASCDRLGALLLQTVKSLRVLDWSEIERLRIRSGLDCYYSWCIFLRSAAVESPHLHIFLILFYFILFYF